MSYVVLPFSEFDILNVELDMCMTEGDIFFLQIFFVFIWPSLLLVSFPLHSSCDQFYVPK